MALSWTYDTLKQALQGWPQDDNPDYVAALDTIIGLGELKLLRDLDLTVFDAVADGSFVASQAKADKPEATLVTRALDYQDYAGRTRLVEPRTYDFVRDYNAPLYDYGLPKYFCELSATQWMLAPVPEACFCYTAHIITRPKGLAADNQNTWLATNAADALFYACLMAAEEYLVADERIAVWRERYNTEILPAARIEFRSLLRSDYSPQVSVEGRR